MNLAARLIGAISLLFALIPGANARAEDNPPAPQYRFGRLSIPAATADEPIETAFSSDSAKSYLDLGATLWSSQKQCVSCHTHGIYMITRPALSSSWGKPSDDLRAFVVGQAKELIESGDTTGSAPGKMAYIARGLAEWDAQFGDTTSPETDAALRHLLAIQADDGSISVRYRWPPLNSDPYHATIMAAIAVATAPGWRSKIQDEPLFARVAKLETYLRKTPPQHDHHRLLLLWASTRLPDLLDAEQRREYEEIIWSQQRDDGGWSTGTFATPEALGRGKRSKQLGADPEFQNPHSDGYQTGLAVIVLRDAGTGPDDPRIQKAVQWLLSNQRESGRWWTRSLNVDSRFHYISYSGTAYAALALAKCGALAKTVSFGD